MTAATTISDEVVITMIMIMTTTAMMFTTVTTMMVVSTAAVTILIIVAVNFSVGHINIYQNSIAIFTSFFFSGEEGAAYTLRVTSHVKRKARLGDG